MSSTRPQRPAHFEVAVSNVNGGRIGLLSCRHLFSLRQISLTSTSNNEDARIVQKHRATHGNVKRLLCLLRSRQHRSSQVFRASLRLFELAGSELCMPKCSTHWDGLVWVRRGLCRFSQGTSAPISVPLPGSDFIHMAVRLAFAGRS